MQRGVQRWIVDISEWNPSPSEFTSAVSVLPQHEHSSITRYLKMEDRKRAFVSRLLQYAVVHEVLGIPFYKIMIRRTVEGKPYLVLEPEGSICEGNRERIGVQFGCPGVLSS
uniref:holo-[acyl-carrier-protein] synthase n=1 Tax=Opuntia streptacantha TaxID=393608 RepID=A0A7C8Z8E3_OPUST